MVRICACVYKRDVLIERIGYSTQSIWEQERALPPNGAEDEMTLLNLLYANVSYSTSFSS